MLYPQKRHQLFLVVATLIVIILVYKSSAGLWSCYDDFPTLLRPPQYDELPSVLEPRPYECPELDGAEDVLVLMKTGGTEAKLKLPVHFDTTLRCVPHFALFSDASDEVEGHKVEDALEDLDARIKDEHPDFELYRQQQNYSREGRDLEELHEEVDFKEAARAWKLDKWKFLPLIDKALQTRPTAQWYIFIEADTFLVWSNVLHYLTQFNSSEALYIGSQCWMIDTIFAHGGSGYIVSNVAARRLSERMKIDPQRFNDLVDGDCCGDVVLSKAFLDVDIHLTTASPVLQGETPQSLDYTRNNWCFPVVTYHHISDQQARQFWAFEQDWLRSSSPSQPILHRDTFTSLIEAETMHPRMGWDNDCRDRIFTDTMEDRENLSMIEQSATSSPDDCRRACAEDTECMQYTYKPGHCQYGNVVRLGKVVDGEDHIESGWMTSKIATLKESLDPCEVRWVTT